MKLSRRQAGAGRIPPGNLSRMEISPVRFRPLALGLALAAALATQAFANRALAQPAPERFEFVAIGDMPYTIPADYPRFERLIDRINALAPTFTVHVGDTKSGSAPCSDEVLGRARDYFGRFRGAVVYSVGDNEWTDCHRPAAGAYDPLERLAWVRRNHFQEPRSLGQAPIPLERQSDAMPERFGLYVENSRWMHQGVLFVSLHIPGSNNNFEIRPGAPEEFFARDAANQAWLADSFAKAGREGALGVVLIFQANMWEETEVPKLPLQSGFSTTLRTLTQAAQEFGRPVLLIHGDSHVLLIDQPLRDARKATLQNVTRLMVMGAAEVHGVRVSVDPAEPGLFGFTPLRVPENMPRLSAQAR